MNQDRIVLQNVNVYQHGLADVLIEDGRFSRISADLQDQAADARHYDLERYLMVPPYVESHIHLDYAYTASQPGAVNASGTLFEGIARWSQIKTADTVESVKERAERALKRQILSGIQYVRTHVDITDPDLTGLKAMLELREAYRDFVEMQIVAFPQEGMYCYPRAEELMEEAIRMGADVIGAIPHFEYTEDLGKAAVKKAVDLAVQYDRMIDIHCDETDDEHSRFLELLAYHALEQGIGARTTASHACAMGSYNNAYAFKLFKLLHRSGINFAVCPSENLYLQGRQDSYPKRRGITRVKELTEAGLNVSFAQDSISDPWYPLGNGNLMNVLDIGLHACQLMSLEEIECALDYITMHGAKTLNLDRYGIREGGPADFIILDAKTPFEAVQNRAEVLCSVRHGRWLFERGSAERYTGEFRCIRS